MSRANQEDDRHFANMLTALRQAGFSEDAISAAMQTADNADQDHVDQIGAESASDSDDDSVINYDGDAWPVDHGAGFEAQAQPDEPLDGGDVRMWMRLYTTPGRITQGGPVSCRWCVRPR